MKKVLMKIIIHLVFLAVFNMIFFFEGVEHTNASWCSYGFATFAYLCLCATPIFAKGSSSAVLIGSLWIQSTTFFFVELIAAIICIFMYEILHMQIRPILLSRICYLYCPWILDSIFRRYI